jgi:hypothetical protein
MRGTAVRVREYVDRHPVGVAVGVVYVALRLILSSAHAAAVTADSTEYLNGLALRMRPPVLPFLYAVLGENVRRITVMQGAVGALCWLALAVVARQLVDSPRAKDAMSLAILLVGLCDAVARWDSAVLSESLSISLGALVLAFLVQVVHSDDRRWVYAFVAAAATWAFTRELNAGFLLFGALVWLVWPHRRPRLRLFAAALVLPAILALSLVGTNGTRTAPLYDVIGIRVLNDQRMTDYFEAHGMPKEVERLRGRYSDAYDPHDPFRTSPDLARFRRWAADHGRSTLLRYIATHPRWALFTPLKSPDMLGGALTNPPLASYGGPGYVAIVPAELQRLIFQMNNTALFIEVLAIVGLLAIGWRRDDDRRWVLAATIAALGAAHAFLAWHGDPMEVGRHSATAAVQLRIGLAIVAVIAGARVVLPGRASDS